jgi:hypothetical protein
VEGTGYRYSVRPKTHSTLLPEMLQAALAFWQEQIAPLEPTDGKG